MSYGESLLSRVVDDNDVTALTRYGIEREHFATEAERQAFDFIHSYAEQNGGEAPSYATFVSETDITYIPDVTDSFEYLARQLKSQAAKVQAKRLLEQKLGEKYMELDGNDFLDWLIEESEKIKMGTRVRTKVGTSLKNDAGEFIDEYDRRKAGKSFRLWKSKFPTINREIGGYISSNIYTWYGRSGRGKSIFVLEEAIEAAAQGATVLYWALEMSDYETKARAYTSISARQELLTAEIDGTEYRAGFDNRALLTGKLDDDFDLALRTFLSTVNEAVSGDLIIRAVNEEGFIKRGVKELQADIIETDADVVVIDPIYLMDFEYNTSRTAGGDIARTAERLRWVAGNTNTVMHIVTQAEETKESADEDGVREINIPTRAELKKSKAILEVSALTIGLDTADGNGVLEAKKGRSGGEGVRCDVLFIPNYGIVREMETGEATASQFNF